MDDLIFKCEHCEQELSVDAAGAGTEIECPSCGESIVIPQSGNDQDDAPAPAPLGNPISASAEAQEERHFSVPQHQSKSDPLITKPLKPLEASAKEGIHLRIKTIRHDACVEVGKDNFDEVVSKVLDEIGEDHLVSITPITYAHQDVGSHTWVNDYGVLIVYRG